MPETKTPQPDAGLQLDELVARLVLGYRDYALDADWWRADGEPSAIRLVRKGRPYSTDPAAAWELVEALKARGIGLVCLGGGGPTGGYLCTFSGPDAGRLGAWQGRGETMPLAICRAALQTVTPED